MDNKEVFNKLSLLTRVCGDEELCEELIRLFLENTPQYIDGLKSSLSKKDVKTLQMQAHTLKGSAITIGAMALSQVAQEMEMAGNSGDISQACNLLDKLESEYNSLKNTLNTM